MTREEVWVMLWRALISLPIHVTSSFFQSSFIKFAFRRKNKNIALKAEGKGGEAGDGRDTGLSEAREDMLTSRTLAGGRKGCTMAKAERQNKLCRLKSLAPKSGGRGLGLGADRRSHAASFSWLGGQKQPDAVPAIL